MTHRRPVRWKTVRWTVALTVAMAAPASTVSAGGGVCRDVQQSTGAVGRICMPAGPWNGDLAVYAHGYVAPAEPVVIPRDQLELSGGTSIPDLVNRLGFAFGTTSYRRNGLAVAEGVEDVADLVAEFARLAPRAPDHVYLIGASEGGLVTALAVEQSPDVFSGGVAACGPLGDFRRQVDYWGDFRVLFDFFFPGLIPGDVVNVPAISQREWEVDYVPALTAALLARPDRLDQVLRVSRAPFDPNDPKATKVQTALGILWYSVFATNDAKATLGGNPYDNSRRLYLGSANDFWLNLLVERYHADPRALAEIDDHYQTSGRLEAPLVTLHTTADPIVPYWHEPLLSLKAPTPLHTNLPVFRYGHCTFQPEEALVALGLLVLKVEGRELQNAERVLTTEPSRRRYRSLARLNGLRH